MVWGWKFFWMVLAVEEFWILVVQVVGSAISVAFAAGTWETLGWGVGGNC